MKQQQKLEFTIPEFISHVPQARLKMLKIGFNAMYSGMHRIIRSNLKNSIKEFARPYIPGQVSMSKYPVKIHYTIVAPINWKAVSFRGGAIKWTKPKKGYQPTWDIDNLAAIWVKILNDLIVEQGILPDDNVSYVQEVGYHWEECKDFEDREIRCCITPF